MKRLYVLLFLFISSRASAQGYLDSIHAKILRAPGVVTINGQQTIYYELEVTNIGTKPLLLQEASVTVGYKLDAKTITTLSFADTVPPLGGKKIVYFNYPLPKLSSADSLFHAVRLLEWCGPVNEIVLLNTIIGDYIVPAQATRPVVLGPPLAGGNWAAVYDPSWARGHRRVYYTVNDTARLPGRFAIDFMKLDEEGHYAKGNEDSIRNWYGYGADVLAVSDGEVVAVRNDFSESKTIEARPPAPWEKAAGNYIALSIGNNQFVFYEHLKPGSVLVTPGQKVKKGAVIAKLGFTGSTTGPHLHFHVANANSTLGAEGIPFVFEQFNVLGGYTDFSDFGKTRWNATGASLRKNERPAPQAVIQFIH